MAGLPPSHHRLLILAPRAVVHPSNESKHCQSVVGRVPTCQLPHMLGGAAIGSRFLSLRFHVMLTALLISPSNGPIVVEGAAANRETQNR